LGIPEDLRQSVGKRVTITLAPEAPGAPSITGLVKGVLEALDGMSVVIEPDGQPGQVQTYHHHYVRAVTPVSK
jgi:hypothetical protein